MTQITNHKQNTPGFTLIEMLISISIFMVFVGLIANSFTSLVKANKAANESQRTYRQFSFVFETFAQEIRSGKLDYSCVAGINRDCIENQSHDKKTILAFFHENDVKRSLFRFNERGKKMEMKRQHKNSSIESDANPWIPESDWQSMTSENFRIEDFYFDVFPLKNPYSSDFADISDETIQWQPSIGIYLKTENGMELKTTYSSRAYGEKQLYANL